MGKKKEQTPQDPEEETTVGIPESSAEEATPQSEEATPKGEEAKGKGLTTLQKIKQQASEGDDAPSGSLRFRDILGGDYLWAVVRNHVWLIILVVFITIAYVAVRYQCQQDAIDISQLERDLVDAKFKALSSSSNLTRLCRQSNVLNMLKENNDSLLHISQRPPYIIEVK